MSKMRIRRYRSARLECLLFKSTASGMPQFVGRISQTKINLMLKLGKVVACESDDGAVLGYELVSEHTVKPVKPAVMTGARHMGPVVCISRAEVEANAGLRGKSRTVGLSDRGREDRIRRNLCEMDLVEATAEKLKVYRQTH